MQTSGGGTAITVLDLFTGERGEVGTIEEGWGYPSFLGDESALIYAAPDLEFGGSSLVKQELTPDKLGSEGPPMLWFEDAILGIIYRRGTFQGTNTLPTVSLTANVINATPPATVNLTAEANDTDGRVAKVEFYNGSVKIGEATDTPYAIVWNNIAAGTYRVVARAIDDVGGATDSTPVNVTVGSPIPDDSLKLSVARLPAGAMRLTLTGPPGDYIIAQSSDLVSWSDIYPVTVEQGGTGSVDDYGGPANSAHLFYKVRRSE
jgi:PKD repeat protein